jgi:hypothetical protein
MVVDRDRGYLLGVTFVGPGVAELVRSATVAVAAQIPINRLWHAVSCFPTNSEVWLRLLEAHLGWTATTTYVRTPAKGMPSATTVGDATAP